MADKVAATYHPSVYTCDKCGARYTSVTAVSYCCSETRREDDD